MASRGVNKVILIGNLGKDPEVRYMPNGKAVANITVATSETWKDQQGQQQERTEWHRCTMYDRLAEITGEYLKKGAKVYLEGKLQTREWQDQQGQKRYTTEIIVSEMQMLDSRGAGGNMGGQPQGGQAQGNWGRPQQAAAPVAAAAAAAAPAQAKRLLRPMVNPCRNRTWRPRAATANRLPRATITSLRPSPCITSRRWTSTTIFRFDWRSGSPLTGCLVETIKTPCRSQGVFLWSRFYQNGISSSKPPG